MAEENLGRYKLIILLTLICIVVPSGLLAGDADEHYRAGRFAQAEEAYKKADMDNPKDIRYRYNRGCAAFQNGDYKGAYASFASVSRRTKDKDILFRSSYNLGNTAFTQGDFSSAVEYYKRAIVYNPEGDDARYNLELALKKLEESKNKKDNDKKCKNDDKGEQQDKEGDKNNDQKDDKNQAQNQDKDKANSKDNKSNQQKQNAEDEEKKKQDLSGKLEAADSMQKRKPEDLSQSPAAMLDKKKAEALLDNIKEDRAKIFQYRMSKEKKGRAGSGKAW